MKRDLTHLPPDERIVERNMPNATPEEKAEARESLKRLAKILLPIEERLVKEWCDKE